MSWEWQKSGHDLGKKNVSLRPFMELPPTAGVAQEVERVVLCLHFKENYVLFHLSQTIYSSFQILYRTVLGNTFM